MAVLVSYLILSAVAGFYVQIYGSRKWKLYYLRIVMLVAFLYMSLRGEGVGMDTVSYLSIFRQIARGGLSAVPRSTELEPGYIFLNYLVSLVSDHGQMIIFVTSAVIIYSLYFLIKNYSCNYGLSAVIFISSVFTITMNATRQFLALGFVFFAVHFILRKKGAKALLMMLLACSTHYSSIIMLPLLLFLNDELLQSKGRFSLILIAICLIFPLFSLILEVFLYIFPQYSRFLTTSLGEENPISNTYLLLLMLLLFLGIWTISSFSIKRKPAVTLSFSKTDRISIRGVSEETQRAFQLFLVIYLLYIVVYILSGKMVIIYRVVYYFQPFLVVFIPMLLGLTRKKSKVLYFFCSTALVVYYLRFGILYFKNDPHGVLPYSFFFE